MAWYNTYRPQTFDDVIGQELVKSVLQNALIRNKIKHAYLLNGPKGVGKTTLARIYANRLNDISNHPESKIDIIELDAASNTGIDDIRQLIESAKIPPISGKYKIFIIDEVHMLSKSAMNALLKILEEPPSYIIFLLATTNPEKLIPTVVSRLTKLNLSAHTEQDIITRLKYIAKTEKLTIDEDALKIIAKRSSGSQRDAINLMETLSAYELDNYNKNNTAELLGLLPEELLEQVTQKIYHKQFDTELINSLEKTGMDGESILIQLLEFLLDKSLSGDTVFDSIIMPIANLLESKLPITSVSGVLALLQVNLRETSPQPITNQTTPQKVIAAQTTAPLDTSLQKSTSQQISYKKVEEPELNTKKPTIEVSKAETGDTSVEITKEDIQNVILALSKDSSSPPIFKMLVPDLEVEKVEDTAVCLSVTNGIFVAQLSSDKLNQWIKDSIKTKLGATCKINVIQREAVPKPLVEVVNENPGEPEKDSEISEEAPKKVEKHQKKSEKSEIFYKIYSSLPEEIKDSKIPIYSQEIPDPENKKTEDNWDNHVEDMFEFE